MQRHHMLRFWKLLKGLPVQWGAVQNQPLHKKHKQSDRTLRRHCTKGRKRLSLNSCAICTCFSYMSEMQEHNSACREVNMPEVAEPFRNDTITDIPQSSFC